jgi:hypothetical protein
MDKHTLTIALAKHLDRGDFSLAGDEVTGYTLYFADGTTTQGSGYDLAAIYAAEEAVRNKIKRIAELKALLTNSDYKVLPDYDKDSEAVKAQRQAWREEIRTLEAQA